MIRSGLDKMKGGRRLGDVDATPSQKQRLMREERSWAKGNPMLYDDMTEREYKQRKIAQQVRETAEIKRLRSGGNK